MTVPTAIAPSVRVRPKLRCNGGWEGSHLRCSIGRRCRTYRSRSPLPPVDSHASPLAPRAMMINVAHLSPEFCDTRPLVNFGRDALRVG